MLRPSLFLILLLIGTANADEVPAPAKQPLRVLQLFPGDLLQPWAHDQAVNTRRAITAAVPGRRIEFFAEGIDGLRLPGTEYETEFVALIRKRYAEVPPDLIVVHGPMDGFVTRQRALLWPDTPVMAASVPDGLLPIGYPEGVPGTSVSYDPALTIELALRLQPDAKRIVVVAGGSEFSRAETRRATEQLAPYRDRLEIEYLVGLPMEELEKRLAALPRDSILLQLPIYRDAAGAIRVARELARRLAEVASVPSYMYYENALGFRMVGGYMANWSAQKDMIGRIARELLLDETRKDSLLMHPPAPSVCVVDWREMKRWKLSLDRLPAGCEVRFREPSLWEQFHREVLVILAVLLIQSALIVALILQRQRRHRMELELQEQRAQLAHAGRLATVGELSASIAHEINQPLAAILSNAEAGEALIKSGAGADQLSELKEILSAIRQDDLRAGDVIERMRRLLHNEQVEMRPLSVNDAIESIVRLTRGLAMRHGVSVQTALDPSLPLIKGDHVQVQQVLLNLIMNAVEAVSAAPADRRRVVITTRERPPGDVEVEVKDSGRGVAADKRARIFDPFFTTKPNGMGLGLSITRSIVHAHRGTIRAESSDNGAIFRFTLPALKQQYA